MKIEDYNCSLDVISIKDDLTQIKQKAINIQKHVVDKIYKVLSINKLNWVNETSYCPGYFNNKTLFLLGNINSIVILDNKLNILKTPNNNIDNLLEDKSDKFMVYPIPCTVMNTNDELIYIDILTQKEIIIKLDEKLGNNIGKYLAGIIKKDKIHSNKNFIKLLIDDKYGKSINKNIIINSNPKFALNILLSYYRNNNKISFEINKDTNIYTFTNILNYVGASYSIRKKETSIKLLFQLHNNFGIDIDDKFMKKEIYHIYDNKITKVNLKNNLPIHNDGLNVNYNETILIPLSSIDFVQIDKTEDIKDLYDLTCELNSATNYTLPFTPMLKNSDGDILAITAMSTKDGIQSAKKFSLENKDYYRNLNDGNINNWIADDAILGLYVATK